MGKKSKAPAGPDYNKLLAQNDKYMAQNKEFMDEYMDFFKSSYADQKELSDKIMDIQLPAMEAEAEVARLNRERYKEMGIPYENEYLDKITNWDNEGRRDERAGEAQAGIGTAAQASREASERRLASFGMDPSQVRSQALDRGLGLQEAIAKAGAGNAERKAVEREGLALGGEAVNLYRGLPSQAAQSLATATGAGQTAMGNQQGLGAYGGQAFGQLGNMNAQGSSMLNAGYGTANNIWGNQLQAHQMDQQNSPAAGLGSLIGTGLSAYATGGMSFLGGLAEGGPVKNYAEGGAIDANAQGTPAPAAAPRPTSEGIPPDNVPVNLSPGEFVIPDDVARWEGEKNLQKIINKAREDRTNTEQQRAQNQRALGIPA